MLCTFRYVTYMMGLTALATQPLCKLTGHIRGRAVQIWHHSVQLNWLITASTLQPGWSMMYGNKKCTIMENFSKNSGRGVSQSPPGPRPSTHSVRSNCMLKFRHTTICADYISSDGYLKYNCSITIVHPGSSGSWRQWCRIKLLAYLLVEQVRVRNDSCTVHDEFRHYRLSCYGPYTVDTEDTSSYGAGLIKYVYAATQSVHLNLCRIYLRYTINQSINQNLFSEQ